MCGLIYGVSFKNKPVNAQVLTQYEKQKSRGRQGFGVFDDRSHLIRKTGEEDMIKWLKKYRSTEILFHHRFPTSTENVKNACHPFSTQDHFETNYILIHNGHISNSWSLKLDHEKQDIKYHSIQKEARKFNDSESLGWDFALLMEGKQKTLEVYGAIAFICLAISKDGKKKLYFGRNTNPLFMHHSKKQVFLASVQGLAGAEVKSNTLYCFDYETKQLTTNPLLIKTYANDEMKEADEDLSRQYQQRLIEDKSNTEELDENPNDYEYAEEDDDTLQDDYDKYQVDDDGLTEQERTDEIKTTYNSYINKNEGYYFAAVASIRKDIREWNKAMLEADTLADRYDIKATISILKSVKDIMMIDPEYVNYNSRHPNWSNPKLALRVALEAKK